MKKNIFLFLFFYCMATSLYAQQRLSLPDVDAIGYDVDGSWIDLYKKSWHRPLCSKTSANRSEKNKNKQSFCSLSDGLGFIFLQRYTK